METQTDSVPAPPTITPKGSDIRPELGAFPHDCESYISVIKWKDSSFPRYNTQAARLQTYTHWPLVKPSSEQLTAAGFYYSGENF
jgi:hypothetical protein